MVYSLPSRFAHLLALVQVFTPLAAFVARSVVFLRRAFARSPPAPVMHNPRYSRRKLRFPAGQRIADAILDYVGQTPTTDERQRPYPDRRARTLARSVARQAALTAGGLTLPPGPVGWLTLLPELRSLWQLQTQLVADIAGCYGRAEQITREEMLYCLFRHTDPQAVRDLVAQIGHRFVVQRASRPQLQAIALKIAIHFSQRLIGRGVSRWIPVFGALGAGAYAYYDTWQVARAANELFATVVEIVPERSDGDLARK